MSETDGDFFDNQQIYLDIELNESHRKEFKKVLKCGIYKELYKRNLISDTQLNDLIIHNM